MISAWIVGTRHGGISDWGEVVTRYRRENLRLDHLLSREINCSLSQLCLVVIGLGITLEDRWGISSAGRAPALHAGGQRCRARYSPP